MTFRRDLHFPHHRECPNWRGFVVHVVCLLAIAIGATPLFAQPGMELVALKQLKSSDSDNRNAATLVKQLSASKDVSPLLVLREMKGATPIGRNWLLGVANAAFQKAGSKPTKELKEFLADTTQDEEARYTVFQWLSDKDPEGRKSMLAGMRQDPSQELRFLAVKDALDAKPAASELESLLQAARHPEQITNIIESLKEAGIEVDQAKHFGFFMNWKLIGPFDHVGLTNFDKVFPVEADTLSGTSKTEYEGKNGTVSWLEKSTDNVQGEVNLAEIFANEKGCIIYALADFDSPTATEAELRLGCINGNKAWVNGKLVMSNEVYHTSMQIDQYVERIRLNAGKNRILLKLCQNEQKEQWAQRFAFQLRITDFSGKAILAKGQ